MGAACRVQRAMPAALVRKGAEAQAREREESAHPNPSTRPTARELVHVGAGAAAPSRDRWRRLEQQCDTAGGLSTDVDRLARDAPLERIEERASQARRARRERH